ncbi:MAG: S8 family peptidase, partial [Bacteroidia bacterium]|nr:S8 family peptidase [Bacteroidia bacterium]
HIPFHLGYTVSADTNFTMFSPSSSGRVYLQMWADTNNFKNVQFSIGADQLTPNYSFRGKMAFSNIQQHIGVLQEDTLYNNGNRIGIIQSYGDVMDDVYSMEFNIIPDSTDYKWRLITTGNGAFDLWNFNMVNSNLPSASVMTDSIYYKKGDLSQTIVSSFQCLDEVITVGNYYNRRSHINYYDTLVTNYTIVPGARVNSSSSGPTRDGRIKPDIMATGDKTISCLTQGMLADFITYLPGELATSSGFHKFGGGTSAASPVVAGIAALYLEKNPTATVQQLKQAVITCAKEDNFTGINLPNNTWGYGKVDAFTTLTGCITTSINNEQSNNEHQLIIYPNPSNNEVNFNLSFVELNSNDKLELNIYNTIGKIVKSIKATNTIITINNLLPAGIYHCELLLNGKKYATEKMIILLPE